MITKFAKNRLVRVKDKDGNPAGRVYRIGDIRRVDECNRSSRVRLIQLWNANHLHRDGSSRSHSRNMGWFSPIDCVLIQNDDPGMFDKETVEALKPFAHNQALLKPKLRHLDGLFREREANQFLKDQGITK